MESVDLVDTHALQAGVDGLFDRTSPQLATMVRGQGENLGVDCEALGCSFGLSKQFLRAPRRSGWISAGGVEVGDIVLFETVQNFLYIVKIDEVHAKQGSAKYELGRAHFGNSCCRCCYWWLLMDRTGERGAINTKYYGRPGTRNRMSSFRCISDMDLILVVSLPFHWL